MRDYVPDIPFSVLTIVVATYGCAPAASKGIVCSPSTSSSLVSQAVSLPLNEVFHENWFGLTGVTVEPGKSCKVFVETIPHPSSTILKWQTFLWSKPDCRVVGNAPIYLSFKKGYVKFDISKKLAVTDPNEFQSTILDERYKTMYPVTKTLADQFGPNGSDASYDPVGHIVEEFEFLPSNNELTDKFLFSVLNAQIARRQALIPTSVEADIEKFRDFFLSQSIVKRGLLDFAATPEYRMCLTLETCFSTPAYDKNELYGIKSNYRESYTQRIVDTLNPLIWADLSQYFHPENQLPDKVASLEAEKSELFGAVERLLGSSLVNLRLPKELPASLEPEAVGMKASFNDEFFELKSAHSAAADLPVLELVPVSDSVGFPQIRGWQPDEFCTTEAYKMFRKTSSYSLYDGYAPVVIGLGSAELTLAGILPLARKRPQCRSCSSTCSASPWQSGGTSILPLPEIEDDDFMVMATEDMERALISESSVEVNKDAVEPLDSPQNAVTQVGVNCLR